MPVFIYLGDYNGTDAVIKIMENENNYLNEMNTLSILGAMGNREIEKMGIPTVYACGIWFKKYYGYTMTMFDGSLEDRWESQNGKISELSILMIFKRGVGTLFYF